MAELLDHNGFAAIAAPDRGDEVFRFAEPRAVKRRRNVVRYGKTEHPPSPEVGKLEISVRRFGDMDTERPDAGKSYQPLPIREINKENSAPLAMKVQMAQMNRQLKQLIDHLHRINHQIQNYQDEKKTLKSSDLFQTTNKKTPEYLTRKDKLTEINIKNLGKRRRFSKFINGVFIFFWVFGIAAAMLAAIVLFFHGPAMI